MQDVVISREMLRRVGGKGQGTMDRDTLNKNLNEKLVFADNGEFFPGAPYLISLVQPMEATILDYVDPAVLILDEPEVLQETHQKFFAALEQRFEQTEKRRR